MNIVMPMAGEGKRFIDAGYSVAKPLISTTERRNGKRYPMVICAMHDLPTDGNVPIFILRTDRDKNIDLVIRQNYNKAIIIGVDHLTEGQACTCLLAREYIDNEKALLIAGCDNGMVYDMNSFEEKCKISDVLVFTYRNNESVLRNPYAYGWVKTKDNSDEVIDVSVKKPISSNPMNDHAVVATFWFRKGSDFVRCADEMIKENDRINGEFYVDQVIKYCLKNKLKTNVFEITKYIGWGTPEDYENYEKTIEYWKAFTHSTAFLPRN